MILSSMNGTSGAANPPNTSRENATKNGGVSKAAGWASAR